MFLYFLIQFLTSGLPQGQEKLGKTKKMTKVKKIWIFEKSQDIDKI